MRKLTICSLIGLSIAGLPLTSSAADAGKTEIEANIEALPASGMVGHWMVGGKKVNVTAATRLEEDDGKKFAIGTRVEVEGNMVGDVLEATSIETDD